MLFTYVWVLQSFIKLIADQWGKILFVLLHVNQISWAPDRFLSKHPCSCFCLSLSSSDLSHSNGLSSHNIINCSISISSSGSTTSTSSVSLFFFFVFHKSNIHLRLQWQIQGWLEVGPSGTCSTVRKPENETIALRQVVRCGCGCPAGICTCQMLRRKTHLLP